MESYSLKSVICKMELTVIVSYYKALENLKLILKALSRQSCNDFELIISEDDNNLETKDYLDENRHLFDFPIHHLNQKEDNGFRKNSMLNRALAHANAERLAFIDGDCVPHHHFVRAYLRNMKKGYFYCGRAVMLDQETSEHATSRQSLRKMNFWTLLFSKSKKVKDGIYFPFFPLALKSRGLVGRNWGVFKKQLLDINGFDNDYILAGVGEDVDVEWRLLKSGLQEKSIKNKAIVYHIYHPKVYSEEGVKHNFEKLKQKQISNQIRCLNGFKAIKDEDDQRPKADTKNAD